MTYASLCCTGPSSSLRMTKLNDKTGCQTLLAWRNLRFGGWTGCGSWDFIASAPLLHAQLFPDLAEFLGYAVSHVPELLHAAGIHLRGEHAVILVGRDADQSLKLSWQQAMSAKRDQ